MRPREPLPPLGMPVAGALLAGVSVVQLCPGLPPLAVSALVLALALAAWWRFGRPAPRLLAAACAGAAWAALFGAWAMSQRLPAALDGIESTVQGQVLGLPRHDDDSQRFDFRIDAGAPAGLRGRRVRVGWYGQGAPRVQAGSHWQLLLRLRRPRGVLDPGGSDAEKAALVQGVAALASVREPRRARLLRNGEGVDALRERLSQRIEAALPEGRARFVQALALGDTRALTATDWEVLRATGLTHQIAISGFHVGMVAAAAALLALAAFRLFPAWGRRVPAVQGAALCALAAASGYSALAGFALPTVRTLLMIAAVACARLLRRAHGVVDGLALALVAVLALDPLSVLAPGFWLSFAGVGWLLWCLPASKSAAPVRGFLLAQAVATIALLPLTAWFFGQASLPGPVANLVGVPAISLGVVPLALLGLLAWPVSHAAASGCWQAAAGLMQWLWVVLEAIAAWPPALTWLPEPRLLAVALACVGAAWLLLPRALPGKELAVLLFLPLLWPALDRPARGEVDIEVLDVGQGLSVLVRTRGHALLYDAGAGGAVGPDFGESVVVPALRALGLRRLDVLLLSHGDADHAGGAPAVRRAFPHARVLGVEGWALPGMGLCRDTQHWSWDGVDFRVLHPPPWFPYLRNESSCVLRIEAGGHVALLPGDIGKQVEARLLHLHADALRAELLLVPHHGSRNSSSGDFVATVAPAWAVASTGAGNRFGLPKAEVVARYTDSGSAFLDTAQEGALGFRLGTRGPSLRAARRRDAPRYWRERPPGGAGYAIGEATMNR
jgi:competence protein ComEC